MVIEVSPFYPSAFMCPGDIEREGGEKGKRRLWSSAYVAMHGGGWENCSISLKLMFELCCHNKHIGIWLYCV